MKRISDEGVEVICIVLCIIAAATFTAMCLGAMQAGSVFFGGL